MTWIGSKRVTLKIMRVSACGLLGLGLTTGCFYSNPQGLYERSIEAIARGNYEQGIDGLDRTLEAQPQFAEAYVNRGIAYAEMGKTTEAIADYQQALALDPNLIDAYYNLGNAYLQRDAYEDAIASYNQVIEREANYGEAYGNRGRAYQLMGQIEKAIEDIETAVNIFAAQKNVSAENMSRLQLEKVQKLLPKPAQNNHP